MSRASELKHKPLRTMHWTFDYNLGKVLWWPAMQRLFIYVGKPGLPQSEAIWRMAESVTSCECLYPKAPPPNHLSFVQLWIQNSDTFCSEIIYSNSVYTDRSNHKSIIPMKDLDRWLQSGYSAAKIHWSKGFECVGEVIKYWWLHFVRYCNTT